MTKLFEQVHTNLSEDLHILNTPATSFLIPPRSGFFMADMARWYDLLRRYSKNRQSTSIKRLALTSMVSLPAETSIFNMVLLGENGFMHEILDMKSTESQDRSAMAK